jgi:zinc protease
MNQKNLFNKKYFAFISIAILLLSCLQFSCSSVLAIKDTDYGGLGAPTDPIPFMADVKTGILKSGLTYFILENSMPEDRAYLFLAVNAGSILEKDDEQGLAHFVEHMAFNSTERFPKSEQINYLRSLGMRWGPEINAYTSFDETVYGIEVPLERDAEGRKRIPERALAVIDDWTRAIKFNPDEVNEERRVIIEEYRTRLGPWDRLQRKILPVLFRGSPYAERIPIGLPEIIETAPSERLVNFYKTWYRADNMALIFVGDFDGALLEAELGSHFSIPAPNTPLDRPYYELPEPKRNNLTVEINTDPELSFTRIDLYYKMAGSTVGKDLAAYREGVIHNLIERMLSFRFDEAAYNPESPYTSAATGIIRYGRASQFYVLMAIVKPDSTEETLSALLREKESITRYGFTADEINQAKRSLLADIQSAASEKDRQDSDIFVNSLTNYFLNGQGVPDITWELEAVTKLLPGITAKEIAAVTKNYFADNDLTVFVSAPDAEKDKLPAADQIRRLAAGSRRMRIPRPREGGIDAKLLDRDPAPGTIVSETTDPDSGTLHWELSNGAKVILKETENRNNQIILYALARGGTTSVPEDRIISANLAAELLSASGLGPYTRTELVKKLAGKQISLGFSLSSFTRNFQGSATTEDLKTLFELLYLKFTQFRIDNDAVASVIDSYRTFLVQQENNPDEAFSNEISRVVFGNNPYFNPMTLADLDKINAAHAMDIVKKGLNPADYTFVFTGNLNIPLIRSYTDSYLASIPRGETWDTWADPHIIQPQKTEKLLYKGAEEKSLVFMGWRMSREYSEAGEAAAAVLSEYLDIALVEKTRKQMGGTYSISAGVNLSPLPPPVGELTMTVYFPCSPGRVQELNAAIIGELETIANGTIDQDAFGKSVAALKKNFEISMQDNSYIGQSYANSAVIFNCPLSRLNKRPALYDAVTPADIQEILKALFPMGPALVILYPEKPASPR